MSTASLAERVPVLTGAQSTALRRWGDVDLSHMGRVAAEALHWPGTVLPATRVFGAVVMPVVAWNVAALARRAGAGQGPVLDRPGVAALLAGDDDAGPVLSSVGFLAVGAPAAPHAGVVALSLYAPAASVTPCPPGADLWGTFEASYYGISVVEYRADGGAVVVVEGAIGANPRARPRPVQERLLREQLFDLAARTGMVPIL